MEAIKESVGRNGTNNPEDIHTIIKLINKRKNEPYYDQKLAGLQVPNPGSDNVVEALTSAISTFQKTIQGLANPDGLVSPSGTTILYLGGIRKTGQQIIVKLDDQNLYACNAGRVIYKFFCASGDDQHPTAEKPSLYRIFRKHEKYVSRTYGARMDYAMFFTMDGKAIHQSNFVTATSILKDLGFSSLGSHGCVRLSEENARTLFRWSPMNTPVFIDMA